MVVKAITNCFLTELRSAPQEETNAWYYKLDQKSMGGKFIALEENLVLMFLLNKQSLSTSLLYYS